MSGVYGKNNTDGWGGGGEICDMVHTHVTHITHTTHTRTHTHTHTRTHACTHTHAHTHTHTHRRYFGEKVAIYFAWVGFYTLFLVPATLVGMVVMLYGLSTLVESRNFLA